MRGKTIAHPPIAPTIVIHPDAVSDALKRLGRNKGVGRDGVPAELLVAAGPEVRGHLSTEYQAIVDSEGWPDAGEQPATDRRQEETAIPAGVSHQADHPFWSNHARNWCPVT